MGFYARQSVGTSAGHISIVRQRLCPGPTRHVRYAGDEQTKIQVKCDITKEEKNGAEEANCKETRHVRYAGDEDARNEDVCYASTKGSVKKEEHTRKNESRKQKPDG